MNAKYWTEERKEWLRQHCNGMPRAEILELYNLAFGEHITKGQLDGAMNRYFINCGYDAKYKKGRTPENKGKSIYEYMSPEAIEKLKKTMFKSGERVFHEVGDVFLKIKHGKYQAFIKTGKGWNDDMLYSRYVWQKETGEELKPQDYIIHLDGNYANCSFDNLMKVNMKDHLRIVSKECGKGYMPDSPELNKAHILTQTLIGTIERKKHGRHKMQQHSNIIN